MFEYSVDKNKLFWETHYSDKYIIINMVFPKQLRDIYTQMENYLRGAGVIPGKSGRHMKFPYTFSAKVAQFPYFHYMKNNNIWMYYPVACVVSLYFIGKIHALANSDANVRSWAETQRKIAEKEHHDH